VSGSHRAPERHRLSTRVLGWADRRAELRAEHDAADRAAGRLERVPAPRLASGRPVRTGPAFYRTARGQLVIGGCAIAAVVLLQVLVPSGDDDPGPPPGEGLPKFGADWSTSAGSRYRISVTPLGDLSSKASADGCVPAPADGFVNARFGVRVENLSGKSAPVPAVDFGANLDARGSADPTMVALPSVRTNVSVQPDGDGGTCADASSIRPDGRTMKNGEARDFVGTVGGISIPVDPGLAVIVSYRDQGSETALLAPFPAFPVGS